MVLDYAGSSLDEVSSYTGPFGSEKKHLDYVSKIRTSSQTHQNSTKHYSF